MTLTPRNGNDKVYTPPEMAKLIVDHFKPCGRILEPCCGRDMRFHPYLRKRGSLDWCEIEMDRDFFEHIQPCDWIVTNPPWSQFRKFLIHAMEVADNIVFLCTINHVLALKARFRDIEKAGFGIVEVLLLDTPPKPWPQSGFQLGAVHLKRGWKGSTHFSKPTL